MIETIMQYLMYIVLGGIAIAGVVSVFLGIIMYCIFKHEQDYFNKKW